MHHMYAGGRSTTETEANFKLNFAASVKIRTLCI